tara:strand:+ start:10567 stop:10812 length:246 start_codon:yes stop_codon:yes gene_type:complete
MDAVQQRYFAAEIVHLVEEPSMRIVFYFKMRKSLWPQDTGHAVYVFHWMHMRENGNRSAKELRNVKMPASFFVLRTNRECL